MKNLRFPLFFSIIGCDDPDIEAFEGHRPRLTRVWAIAASRVTRTVCNSPGFTLVVSQCR